MADKGIIFSGAMVRALLDGRKTQTRRLLTLRGHRQFSQFGPSDTAGYDWHFRRADGCWCDHRFDDLPLPYAIGDRLYVRESWAPLDRITHNDPGTQALVDGGFFLADRSTVDGEITRWTPAIHMPRSASRLWLAVSEVRVQRLQHISEADAIAEGIEDVATAHFGGAIKAYAALWNSLHGAENDDSWEANPWIVAVSFAVHHGNIGGAPQ